MQVLSAQVGFRVWNFAEGVDEGLEGEHADRRSGEIRSPFACLGGIVTDLGRVGDADMQVAVRGVHSGGRNGKFAITEVVASSEELRVVLAQVAAHEAHEVTVAGAERHFRSRENHIVIHHVRTRRVRAVVDIEPVLARHQGEHGNSGCCNQNIFFHI